MRSGHIARLAAVTSAVLVTGACASPGGVAGISTLASHPRGGQGHLGATVRSPRRISGGRRRRATPIPQTAATTGPSPTPRCSSRQPKLLVEYTYVFPVQGCRVTYGARCCVLPKTTIWAGKGCPSSPP